MSRFRMTPTWLGVFVYLGGVGAALAALLFQTQPATWVDYLSDPYLWRLVRFSILQAFLSAVISIGLALPVISALYHNQSVGQRWLLSVFSVSIVVPTIVAILGIVIVYGRYGWFNELTGASFPLYGLWGILLAHVFFNLPLVVRIGLQVYGLIPDGQWRLASQLGLSRWHVFNIIEWPYLKLALPGTFLLVFLLCFSSFAVVLSLGGGPKSSTLEVAIYQALRFEFDLNKAAFLAILQILICVVIGGFVFRYIAPSQQDLSLVRQQVALPSSKLAFYLDWCWIGVAALWVIPPFIAVLSPMVGGIFWQTLKDWALWKAVWVSLKIALPAGGISVAIALCLLTVARPMIASKGVVVTRYLELVGSLVLMVPGMVLATGMFLLFRWGGISLGHAYWVVVWVNAVMALPFVLRVLTPSVLQEQQRFGHLYCQLNIVGWTRFRLEWIHLRKPIAQGLAFAVLLSLGDLGVVALFGSKGLETLPLYLYRLIGSYRIDQGSCVAVVLVLLCVGLFYVITRFVGGRRAAC